MIYEPPAKMQMVSYLMGFFQRMFKLETLITIIAVFTHAGAVKGVIGLGLPAVSLDLLAGAIDFPTAIALLLSPFFVTTVWQPSSGGSGKKVIKRILKVMSAIEIIHAKPWTFVLLPTKLELFFKTNRGIFTAERFK